MNLYLTYKVPRDHRLFGQNHKTAEVMADCCLDCLIPPVCMKEKRIGEIFDGLLQNGVWENE